MNHEATDADQGDPGEVLGLLCGPEARSAEMRMHRLHIVSISDAAPTEGYKCQEAGG
jgi:hypothetical protein